MILNKFSIRSFSALRVFSIQLLTISLCSCNKSAGINANKAYVSLTHVAYGVGPLNLVMGQSNNIPLFSVPDSFGMVTGVPGNPYDTTTSRVTFMRLVLAKDTSDVVTPGNSAFQQQTQYSIFAFDSSEQQRPLSLIIFQDNPPVRLDTNVYIRFMNFSPGPIPWGLKLINTRNDIPYFADTILIGAGYFVGDNLSPTSYRFSQVRIGKYQVFAYTDSSNPHVTQGPPRIVDSSNFVNLGKLTLDSMRNYNIYIQGFYKQDTGINKFQLKSVRLN